MAAHSTAKVVKNAVIYTAATIAQKAISFVYFWILSANVSPGVLGSYLSMLALASIFSIGMDLGLTPLLTREAAREEGTAARLLRATYALKVPLVVATVALLWLVALLGVRPTGDEPLLLLGATVIVCLDAFTSGAYAVLRARQNVAVESRAILLFQSTVFALGLTALFTTRDIRFVMGALVAGSAVNAVYTVSRARKILGDRIAPSYDRAPIRALTARLPAFAASGIFTKVYQQADVVLLRVLAGAHAVGLYAIPAKITTALQTLIPGAMSAAVYPTMANFAHADRRRLETLWSYAAGLLFLVSLPIGLLLSLLTPAILAAVWPQYAAAGSSMRLMLLAVPALFLPYATGPLLNAVGKERWNSANRGIMTVVNVLLNLLLIPLYGVWGAAVAFTGANVLLAALDLGGVRHDVRVWNPDFRRLTVGALAASVPASLVGWLAFRGATNRIATATVTGGGKLLELATLLLPTLFAAGATYLLILFVSRTLRREDFAAVRTMLKRGGTAV